MRSFFIFLIVFDVYGYPDPKLLIFFKHQKFRIRHNQHNQTQWHKVNDFDFCFVSKCLHISNSRTKPAGPDFQYVILIKVRRVRLFFIAYFLLVVIIDDAQLHNNNHAFLHLHTNQNGDKFFTHSNLHLIMISRDIVWIHHQRD